MTPGTLDRTSNKRCYRETEAHGEKWELSARNKHQSPAATQHQPSAPGFPRAMPNHSLHGRVSYCQELSWLLVPCTHVLVGHLLLVSQ